MEAVCGTLPLMLLAVAVWPAGATQVRFRTLAQGQYSAVGKAGRQVIREARAFPKLWANLRQRGAAPRVDFRREMVVAVFTGERPTAGHRVEITRIEQEGQDLVVHVRRQSPPTDAIVAQVITAPFHVVAVPRVTGRVRFVEAQGVQEETTTMQPRTLARGFHSGITERRLLVVNTSAQWRALWREHTASVAPPPSVPAVDYEREMVLAVLMGEQRTGGYAVEIAAVRAGRQEVCVVVRETRPEPGQPVTQALTQPFHFVAVPRSSLPVRFLVTPSQAEVESRDLGRGDQSAIRDRLLTVIRTPAAWQGFWRRHTAGVEPPPARPRVNLDREMVIVALMGEQQTSGYAIRIQNVVYGENEVVVHVRERQPEGDGALLVRTRPFHCVAVPRSDLNVRFEVERD
ncbi:MAG: protease complex subunit PrcB family protein [Armatimonadetes bacterium]|nr:protease complex subunit PrcB family protein [Armatimonadota bacterium]